MQKCGFCSMFSGLLRRATCLGSRRGSSESYYRELGDQDTLKIEDRSSDVSDESVEIETIQPIRRRRSADDCSELANMSMVPTCPGKFLTMHKRRKKKLVTRSLCQHSGLLDDQYFGQVQCILRQSMRWKFNAFTLENVSGGRCLPVLCLHLFHIHGLISYFKLDAARVWSLLTLIEEGYHSSNPYHNAVHAADVTQAMHCFLQQKKIREHMEPLEVMASLLAAIAHDLDHPGVNQPFLIATSNHLAALYRNTSVLENHHWRSAISCFIESGILDQMTDARAKLKSQISSLIMATDITRQQEYLSNFKGLLDRNSLDMTKREHRHLVLQIALKCADISNPCRSWEISRKWSLKVCEEFFRQGDYERKLNLPVTALCDRHTTTIPKIQTGFFKFVVTPLISEWHAFLHNELSSQMFKNLQYNHGKWEELAAEELAEETKTEVSEIDVADADLDTETGTNISDSSELLIPPRRSSLNQTKPIGFREQLRRFSVPLNVFQDSKFKNREKSRASLVAVVHSHSNGSPMSSDFSLHSQLSVERKHAPVDKILSSELLPDSSITSITTPVQAMRLNTVIKDGGSWKLIRQQTFPPLESVPRVNSFAVHPLHTSNEDVICTYNDAALKRENARKESIFSNFFRRNDKTDNDASQNNYGVAECSLNLENQSTLSIQRADTRDSNEAGSQLRDNLSSVQLSSLSSDQLHRRRKSMPGDVIVPFTHHDRKIRDIPARSQFLGRTVSGKECSTRRRGSAPAPFDLTEVRSLAAAGTRWHSVNGGRRRQTPISSCHQWLAKTHGIHDSIQPMPRRSSLPVEVITGINSN